jgi:hypothetical protein
MAARYYKAAFNENSPPVYDKSFGPAITDTDLRTQSGRPMSGAARLRIYNAGAEQNLVYYAYGNNPVDIDTGLRALANTTTIVCAAGLSEILDVDCIALEATGTGADISVTAFWWDSGIPKNP